jgi:2-polyprenyl-6-methoxyphenol hydroxylase-like FAD-dependent oxidoreductase
MAEKVAIIGAGIVGSVVAMRLQLPEHPHPTGPNAC